LRLRLILIAATMLVFPGIAGAQKNLADHGVNHGTVNIVLANQNGIVVLTDSMVTDGDGHQLPGHPAQKLFKLDDKTVCAIAGFLSAPGPVEDFYTNTSAIISYYAKQTAIYPELSILQKLSGLATAFTLDLTTIATLREAAGAVTAPMSYKLQLTIAGYDIDGSYKIGQVTLVTVPEPTSRFLESVIQNIQITTVDKFVYKLAGQPDIADRLLQDPSSEMSDLVLTAYATSRRRDDGRSMSVAQMRDVAARLAWYTAQSVASVGGENQIAVLEKGHVSKIDQAVFQEPGKPPFQLFVFAANSFGGSAGAGSNIIGPALVMINTFSKTSIPLDGNYFFSNQFTQSVLKYGGGPLYFDKSNQVLDCQLLLGPDVKLDNSTVQQLVHDFHWRYGVGQAVDHGWKIVLKGERPVSPSQPDH
jgi:hypothetical protein